MSSREVLEKEIQVAEDKLSQIIKLIEDLKSKKVPYPPRLTKYEIARIVAARAKQLANGARPLIDTSKLDSKDPVIIALQELKEGKLPIIVIRTLPNGKKVEVSVKELLSKYEIFTSKILA